MLQGSRCIRAGLLQTNRERQTLEHTDREKTSEKHTETECIGRR